MGKKNKGRSKRPTLILEGCDCSGKTTLGREIQKMWSCKYVHTTQAPKGADTLVHFIGSIGNVRQPTIIDRYHWSEEIYAKILREDSLLDDRDFGVLDGYIMAYNGIIVHCNPPLHIVLNNIKEDKQGENHNLQTATKVWHEYNKYPRTVLPIITYDYTQDKVEDLVNKAIITSEAYYGDYSNYTS